MENVSVDELEPRSVESGADVRALTGPLGTTGVAINRYRVEPGDRLSGGLHAHVDQEEVFVVVDGEATFETLSGEITAGAGEAIRFGPGEFQSGKNASDDEVVVYALGAPRDATDTRVPLACSACDHPDLRPAVADGETPVLVCPDCGNESSVECAECGSENKRVVLADDGETPVDACSDCGSQSPAR